MDDRTLISHLLKGEEITYKSKLYQDTTSDIYCTFEEIILNKWHSTKKTISITPKIFHRLLNSNIIELTSGNFENGEQHYQIIYCGDMLNSLKNLVRATTNTEFETIFKDILLRYERKLKLKEINGKIL